MILREGKIPELHDHLEPRSRTRTRRPSFKRRHSSGRLDCCSSEVVVPSLFHFLLLFGPQGRSRRWSDGDLVSAVSICSERSGVSSLLGCNDRTLRHSLTDSSMHLSAISFRFLSDPSQIQTKIGQRPVSTWPLCLPFPYRNRCIVSR